MYMILLADEVDATDDDLAELLAAADRLAGEHRLPDEWVLDRDDVHERV